MTFLKSRHLDPENFRGKKSISGSSQNQKWFLLGQTLPQFGHNYTQVIGSLKEYSCKAAL